MRYDAAITAPWPWWVAWMDRAERWHVPPWELFDGWTPRLFWIACDVILQSARARHRAWQETKQG